VEFRVWKLRRYWLSYILILNIYCSALSACRASRVCPQRHAVINCVRAGRSQASQASLGSRQPESRATANACRRQPYQTSRLAYRPCCTDVAHNLQSTIHTRPFRTVYRPPSQKSACRRALPRTAGFPSWGTPMIRGRGQCCVPPADHLLASRTPTTKQRSRDPDRDIILSAACICKHA
jgi:hypothetical protein